MSASTRTNKNNGVDEEKESALTTTSTDKKSPLPIDESDDSFRGSDDFDEESRNDSELSNDTSKKSKDQLLLGSNKENNAVQGSKVLVFIVLLLAAGAVGTITHIVLSNEQTNDFRNEYRAMARELVGAAENYATSAAGFLEGLSVSIASHVEISSQERGLPANNFSWPLVALPDWEIRARVPLALSNARALSLVVKVVDHNNEQQEQQASKFVSFAQDNQEWIEKGIEYYNVTNSATGKLIHTERIPTDIVEPTIQHGQEDGHLDTLLPPYQTSDGAVIRMPQWQTAPPPYSTKIDKNESSGIILQDLLQVSFMRDVLERAHQTKASVVSEINHFGFMSPAETEAYFSDTNPLPWDTIIDGSSSSSSSSSTLSNESEESMRRRRLNPQILMAYAIPAPLRENDNDDGDTTMAMSGTVAYVTAILDIERFLSNVLPPNTDDFIAVVDDGCAHHVTYRVNGPDAIYVGPFDYHDGSYNDLVETLDYVPRKTSITRNGTLTTTMIPNFDGCRFRLRVYPTKNLEESYYNNMPLLYAAIVVSVFIFTGAVFKVYDWKIEQRQDKVISTAKKTNAIISALFPKNVQERLFNQGNNPTSSPNEATESDEKGPDIGYGVSERNYAAKNQLKEYLHKDKNEKAQYSNHNESQHGPSQMLGDNRDQNQGNNKAAFLKTKPIADLFPETTVMFADLVGFTAWSSTREPSQVFTLLETIYHAFDVIAKRRRVFKVETVGDCYVAVAGLPEPRKDHAVVMARFARDCLYRLMKLTKQLEETLGPDTADLALRVGLHSGPVTAGVLRGEKARFQLFGDTVNTTSRMEGTSKPNKIQISQETADLIIEAGKSQWVRKREELVTAKGKGALQTYWLDLHSDVTSSINSSTNGSEEEARNMINATPTQSDARNNNNQLSSSNRTSPSMDMGKAPETALEASAVVDKKQHQHVAQVLTESIRLSEKHARLVNWNTEVLGGLLNEIAKRRRLVRLRPDPPQLLRQLEKELMENKGLVLDEVRDIITLPRFSATALKKQQERNEVAIRTSSKRFAGMRSSQTFRPAEEVEIEDTLSENVLKQLHDYVEAVAAMYRENPFHGFEHASHVTMSVVKLLARIVAPDLSQQQLSDQTLHDHTYGITSDPLTQFVCVFTAVIHDLDHPGVPNSQLVKEKSSLAVAYKNKSVAEQNSVDLAWDLLMEDHFIDLRGAIYKTEDEFRRFRQLLVNSVMATDVMDRDLGAARKARWNKAFGIKEDATTTSPPSSVKAITQRHDEAKAALNSTDDGGVSSIKDPPDTMKKGVAFLPMGDETEDQDQEDINRKATIVIEHLIQASDVAHTMQHWHIYRKWNSRLFEEMYRAYREGRMDKDPAENWYKGEIGFFDFYVIPLAKKLKDCGVFGVSSDEYFIYAQKNRQEWEMKGQEVVAELLEERKRKYKNDPAVS